MKKWQSVSLVIGSSTFGIGIITTTAIIAKKIKSIEGGGNDSLKIIDVVTGGQYGDDIVFLANQECFWGATRNPENKDQWNSNKMFSYWCAQLYNYPLYFTLDSSFKTYKLACMRGGPY